MSMRYGWMKGFFVAALLAAASGAASAQPDGSVAETRLFLFQTNDTPPADGPWRGGTMLGTWPAFIPVDTLPADIRKPGIEAEARLVVDVDDKGAVTGCSEWERPAPEALAQAACTALRANARFAPRRLAPGPAIASRRLFLLRIATKAASEWAELERRLSPSPPPPPGASPVLPRERDWPVRQRLYGAISPGPLPPLAGPETGGRRGVTGLLLDILPDGTRHCEVMEKAGDPARDAAACAAAVRIEWQYDRPCDLCYPQRIPILARWEGGKSRLELPSRPYGASARLVGEPIRPGDLGPQLPAGLQPHITIEIPVDTKGRPGLCRVGYSSGDAALDRRICDLVVKRGRFSVSTDLFGRVVAGELVHYVRLEKLYPAP